MIVYISDLKIFNREVQQPINTFTKVAGYKINSQKIVTLIYANSKLTKKEIRDTTLFILTSNNKNYLRITLAKQVKGLHDKNVIKDRN